MQSFINALAQIPLCDPTLPVWLRDALEKSGTDSSHVIREAYRLFTLLEESVKERVLEWMEQAGEANYRLRAVGALVAFEKKGLAPGAATAAGRRGSTPGGSICKTRASAHRGEMARGGYGTRKSVCWTR